MRSLTGHEPCPGWDMVGDMKAWSEGQSVNRRRSLLPGRSIAVGCNGSGFSCRTGTNALPVGSGKTRSVNHA